MAGVPIRLFNSLLLLHPSRNPFSLTLPSMVPSSSSLVLGGPHYSTPVCSSPRSNCGWDWKNKVRGGLKWAKENRITKASTSHFHPITPLLLLLEGGPLLGPFRASLSPGSILPHQLQSSLSTYHTPSPFLTSLLYLAPPTPSSETRALGLFLEP